MEKNMGMDTVLHMTRLFKGILWLILLAPFTVGNGLFGQTEQDSSLMQEFPSVNDCLREARQITIADNLTIKEMYALCGITQQLGHIAFGFISFPIEEVKDRRYNELKLDAFRQMRSDLLEKMANP
ncbi:MAG: hypothetical protein AAFY91_07300, partial [Bacteroidota bacterium]